MTTSCSKQRWLIILFVHVYRNHFAYTAIGLNFIKAVYVVKLDSLSTNFKILRIMISDQLNTNLQELLWILNTVHCPLVIQKAQENTWNFLK